MITAATTTTQPDPFFGWLPRRWGQFAGNRLAVKAFKKLVRRIRGTTDRGVAINGFHLSLLLTGASRSGKTSMVQFFVRCLVCEQLNLETLDPCDGTCAACRARPELGGFEELFSYIHADPLGTTPVNLVIVDCAKISGPNELKIKLSEIRGRFGLQIVYFDEVHRLKAKGMDEMLMKEVEQTPYLWIFSTAKPQELEPMFVNRSLIVKTELPTASELGDWLKDRCEDVHLLYQTVAIERVVQRCNRVAGIALLALSLACLDPEIGLTLYLVDEEWMMPDEA